MLRDAGLPPNTVPPRLFLPLIEAASAEDNESLQEMWAGLLANASHDAGAVSASFVETLKQLSPAEARFLETLNRSIPDERYPGERREFNPFRFRESNAPSTSQDSFERLGLIRREFAMTRGEAGIEPDVGYLYVLTRYASRFLEACHGPRAGSGQ
jgi:hypothetical protein